MRLTDLHVRFYKAFNFDYMRKYDGRSRVTPWELMEDGSWYPFVTVPMEHGITTIVGANESGKTQVLDAIEIALSGEGLHRTDFCRYSRFFLVDSVRRLSDLGVTVGGLSQDEGAEVSKACGRGSDQPAIVQFTLIRAGDGKTSVYVQSGGRWETYLLNAKMLKLVQAVLPVPFRLRPEIPLPDAVPLAYLARGGSASSVTAISSRAGRLRFLERLMELPAQLAGSSDAVTKNAARVAEALVAPPEDRDDQATEKYRLADSLLVDITGVAREHFADLITTIGAGRDGYVDGVEELINRSLASRLNFRRWWTQDSSFQLRVTVRESDIAFIVRDRTGTHYSFSERSGGLGYFLSYFVQYLSHRPLEQRDEILLMDEPDTFLSSQGQKDLLRIFDAFADPEDGSRGCQVVYVTHSPFLIDRNHAERIRVIEKGEEAEGTRVVHDVSRNHYEPLRSAFGAFVAETTFMGNCNLMVEGISDQVLLAGVSRRLRRGGIVDTDYLDLNDITLVPAGGAPHIPYLVYLARGRDIEKPAVIVLLDADPAGDAARRAIQHGGAYRKALVPDDLILQLRETGRLALETDRPGGAVDIEDLIPIEIALRAVERYATEFLGLEPLASPLDPAAVVLDDGVLAGAAGALNDRLPEPVVVDKLGFARSVLDELTAHHCDPSLMDEAVARLDRNFASLCRALNTMRRAAVRQHNDVRLLQRIARVRNAFLDDHPSTIRKVDVHELFEEIAHVLDDSPEAEDTRSDLRRLRLIHNLDVDAASPIENVPALREDLFALQYGGRQRSQEGYAAPNQPSAVET